VISKIARKIATDGEGEFHVAKDQIETYLGNPSFEHEFAEREPEIGVATGLAWTSSGGEIMFIEASRMPGTGGRSSPVSSAT
jgi:ATP-dependent Lon protease